MEKEVYFEEQKGKETHLGIITLNRPQVLNALNHNMIKSIHHQLETWANDPHIKAVIIKAVEGRAFCAGGDLRAMFTLNTAGKENLFNFFYDEYQLNRYIFHYPKPYIALLDGITMGGGAGISIPGSHRIGTERLLFAMPETAIGFFPDVGGTYFLPRLPCHIGFYLGLTGEKIGVDDCHALGIIQHKMSAEHFPQVIDALLNSRLEENANAQVTHLLNEFSIKPTSSGLLNEATEINQCFSKASVEEILLNIKTSNSLRCQESEKILAKKSPTSLKVTLKALQNGAQCDFDTCMKNEYRLTSRFLQGHDFFEGIRALIVDKDQNPHWKPPYLAQVTPHELEQYFSPLQKELSK